MFIANGTGDQTDYGIGYDHCRNLASGQHIVAYRDFFRDEMFADTVVYTFVVAAENDEVLRQREGVGHRLVKLFAVRRGEYNLVIVTLRFQVGYGAVYRFDLHYHSCFASEGVVIDLAVLVCGVFTQIVDHYFAQSFVLRAF